MDQWKRANTAIVVVFAVMKSLMPVAPPVPEEDDVDWHREHCYWGFRSADFGAHLEFCMDSDSRDAYVMLFLEGAKANGCHNTLTRAGQLYGFIGSFVRLPAIPPRDEDYA